MLSWSLGRTAVSDERYVLILEKTLAITRSNKALAELLRVLTVLSQKWGFLKIKSMLQELDIGFCRDGVLNLQFQHYLTDRNEPVSHSHTPMESASGFLFLSCMSCTWNGPEFILVRCEELLWDWRRASHPDFTVLSSLHTCCFVNNLLNILHWLWGRQSLHFTFLTYCDWIHQTKVWPLNLCDYIHRLSWRELSEKYYMLVLLKMEVWQNVPEFHIFGGLNSLI